MSYIYNLADTWDNAGTVFTAIKMDVTDVASNASSALLDLQVGGVSQFKVSKAGAVTAVGIAIPTISSTDTLSNKTLSSPVLSGTVSGSPTFSGALVMSGSVYPIRVSDGGYIRFYNGSSGIDWALGKPDANQLIFYRNGSAWFQFDSNGAPFLNSVAVPTISSTDTLTNKTLSSPTLSGTVAGSPTFSGSLTLAGGHQRITQVSTGTSPATSGSALTNIILRVGASNVGAAGYGLDVGTSNTTGQVWLQARDWSNYATNVAINLNPNGGGATLGGVAIPTISSTDTLSNKTISSPTISGTIAGNVTASGTWNFSSASTGAIVTITSTDAGADAHSLDFFRNSASPAASDVVGQIRFLGKNASGTTINYARADSYITDPTAGSEDATFRISNYIAGSQVDTFVISDVATFYVSVAHADATNISVGTTTGTKIGTATTQKLGFFNATPVVQPTAVADATDAASVITQLNALLARMRNLGLIAT